MLWQKYDFNPIISNNKCSLYFLDGHFLLAVTSGDISMPIQCYKVSVKKVEEKCVITSQSLPSFFLCEGAKEGKGINFYFIFNVKVIPVHF